MIFIIYLLISDGLGGRIFVELMVYISLQLYILLHLDSCILGSRALHFTYRYDFLLYICYYQMVLVIEFDRVSQCTAIW